MNLSRMALQSTRDPIIMIFGEKLLKRGWRKVDKDYVTLEKEINTVLKAYIDKHKNQKGEGGEGR